MVIYSLEILDGITKGKSRDRRERRMKDRALNFMNMKRLTDKRKKPAKLAGKE
jgi:hypothetical protein